MLNDMHTPLQDYAIISGYPAIDLQLFRTILNR
jgi:hypothetical protein